MKFILALLCATQVLAFTPLTRDQISTHYKDCATEHGIAAESLDAVKAGTYTDADTAKAFTRCVGRKSKILDADGQIIVDNSAKQVHAYNTDKNLDDIKLVVEKCKTERQEQGYLAVLGCIRKNGYKATSTDE